MPDDKPICLACGGSGAEEAYDQPDLKAWPLEHRERFGRQVRNRPRVLEGLDRYLGADEKMRLEAGISLVDFLHGTLGALTDIAHIANQTRALEYSERAPLVIEALDGLFVTAGEIVHFLASRAHPVEQSDFRRIAEEQKIMREIEDALRDPDSDLGTDPTA